MRAWSLSLVLVVGCLPSTDPPDAPSGMDAFAVTVGDSGRDAQSSATDAASVDSPPDAWRGMDASWGPCSVMGQGGRCVATAACSGRAVPGYCPGPSDIQCCLPAAADSGFDAPRVDAPGALTPSAVTARLGACTRLGGDYATDSGGRETIPICRTGTAVWFQADFDIDCDGGSGAICMSDPYYQPETSGVDSRGRYLDASTLPFYVLPLPSTRFRYSDHDIRIGQVGAVMYRDRIVYGIFGDAGPSGAIGEGSFAMAEALGIPSDPIRGGVASGVTYVVFPGASARVAHNESHAEAVALGERLLRAFVGAP